MRNLEPNKHIFRANGSEYDLSAYTCLDDFLSEVWGDCFRNWDGIIVRAEDVATRCQDRAELFWRKVAE